MDDNNNNNNEDILEELVDNLRGLATREGLNPQNVIDLEMCRNVLQVTGNNVLLGAQFYWDNFLATQHQRQEPAQRQPLPQQDNDNAAEDLRQRVLQPELRRRLEHDFEQQLSQQQQRDHDEEGDVAMEEAADAGESSLSSSSNSHQQDNSRARRNNKRLYDNREDNANVAGLAVRAAQAFLAARGDDSVSVSDDDNGWKMVGGIAARLSKEGLLEHQLGAPSVSPKRRKKREEEKTKQQKEDDIDRDGYISENDWLWKTLETREQIPTNVPCPLLWGQAGGKQHSASRDVDGDADNPKESDAAANEGNDAQADEDEDALVNVIAAEEEGNEEAEGASGRPGIPLTWLNTGFGSSDDGTSLALQSPTEDDISYFAWQNQDGNSPTEPPPPFHCGSISALMAIVNGLIYTGATYAPGQTSFRASRKPFAELTEPEQKRELEPRLADALAALLQIAAGASRRRKERALQSLKTSKKLPDQRKWQKLQAKLNLCPTCRWVEDASGHPKTPQGRDTDSPIQVSTSFTHIQDLRKYVVSNMRSFRSRGGCALFLETIVQIHGKGAILRMMREAKASKRAYLVKCQCKEHRKKMKIDAKKLKQRSTTKELLEAVPETLDCMSVELISLLLTGKVHSSYKGWSTAPFGLGILTHGYGQVSRALSRPERPVWMLRGPNVYSLLALNECFEDPKRFAEDDQPSSTVPLTHLNFWPGYQQKSLCRLCPPKVWSTQMDSKPPAKKDPLPGESLTTCLLLERRREAEAKFTSDVLNKAEEVDPLLLVSEQQLGAVVANGDDQKFYPGKYRLWRYSIPGSENEDSNVAGLGWVPYHRLTERQKVMVEMKLGPKIASLLWTRWPRAEFTGFSPAPLV